MLEEDKADEDDLFTKHQTSTCAYADIQKHKIKVVMFNTEKLHTGHHTFLILFLCDIFSLLYSHSLAYIHLFNTLRFNVYLNELWNNFEFDTYTES